MHPVILCKEVCGSVAATTTHLDSLGEHGHRLGDFPVPGPQVAQQTHVTGPFPLHKETHS